MAYSVKVPVKYIKKVYCGKNKCVKKKIYIYKTLAFPAGV